MAPVAWSEVTWRKRPVARSLPPWLVPRPGRSLFRRFRSNLALPPALQLCLRPVPRPGRSLFRRFRSNLALPPALQLCPWPPSRPGRSLFRRFRSNLADGAPAAASPWHNKAAWEEHRDGVEQLPSVEHRRAHGDDSVRTRDLGAHGAEFFLVSCAREAFPRTGSTSCARDWMWLGCGRDMAGTERDWGVAGMLLGCGWNGAGRGWGGGPEVRTQKEADRQASLFWVSGKR